MFADLMALVDTVEVRQSIVAADGGKSPGHDGCNIDLFKIIPDEDLLRGEGRSDKGATSCLLAITDLVNHCLRLNYVPPVLKEGWITMVPKPNGDGSFTTDADQMRPITVLPELAKVTSRILAARLAKTLARFPDVMSPAQRGFHKDGSVEQGVAALVDIIEDWNQRRGAGEKVPLYVVSYDQAKAYDSVQAYTIRASRERFNTPENFIQFVLSSVTDASSRVRTFHGLTEAFTLQSSVRQGDPLAPLIYAIITDAMHEGLRDNPLVQEPMAREGGYTFAGATHTGARVRVCSVGYADDAAIAASDPHRLLEMHEWIREFYGAHCFTLNCSKTKYLCSDIQGAPRLHSVSGRKMIAALPGTTIIRYLGARVNLYLNWREQRTAMHRAVWHTCSSIVRGGLDLEMSVMVVRQFLLPRLRLPLQVARVPVTTLDEWDIMIRKAVYRAANITSGRSLAKEIFHAVTGLPRLRDHSLAMQGEELAITLNANYPSSLTCWARLGGVLWSQEHPGSARWSRAIWLQQALREQAMTVLTRDPETDHSRSAADLVESMTVGTPVADNWTPDKPPKLYSCPPTGYNKATAVRLGSNVCLYTDGSTGKARGKPSGCSVVLANEKGEVLYKRGFALRASGNNYLAEMVAYTTCLRLSPCPTFDWLLLVRWKKWTATSASG
jgi:hypothetical protein